MELVPLTPELQPPDQGASTALVPLTTTGLRRVGGELSPVCLFLSSSTLIGLRVYLDEFARQLAQQKMTSTTARTYFKRGRAFIAWLEQGRNPHMRRLDRACLEAYREYLDRIDSTVFGPRYAELAPMPFEDDTGDPQAMPTHRGSCNSGKSSDQCRAVRRKSARGHPNGGDSSLQGIAKAQTPATMRVRMARVSFGAGMRVAPVIIASDGGVILPMSFSGQVGFFLPSSIRIAGLQAKRVMPMISVNDSPVQVWMKSEICI